MTDFLPLEVVHIWKYMLWWTDYVFISVRFMCYFFFYCFSKIQNKKPFVKGFRRKAGYSLNQSIFFEKYITIASIINSPKLPANNAKVSSWIRTNI